MEDSLKIEMALRAGQIAKYALEFTNQIQSEQLLILRYKQLTDEINSFRKCILRAIEFERGRRIFEK
jgi:hypothetical protein